jgi:hypothetical protein
MLSCCMGYNPVSRAVSRGLIGRIRGRSNYLNRGSSRANMSDQSTGIARFWHSFENDHRIQLIVETIDVVH